MRLYPKLTWHKNRMNKAIYLTFDDGPIPGPTEFVLDTLGAFDAKATFFCVGDNVRKHSAIFQRILAEGHSVGNHTFNHKNGWKTNDIDYLENVNKGYQVLLEHGGTAVKSRLFRPPYGKIKRSQIRSLRPKTDIVMWEVLSGDFDTDLPAAQCLQRSIRASTAGAIVVFHDSLKAEASLRYTLPRYMEHFQAEGYTFDRL